MDRAVVIGNSAETVSVLEFALRHPQRHDAEVRKDIAAFVQGVT
jgi:hypothetical protein